jgi:pyruvate ferredoxin oxidoreductase gamma subunit
VALFEGLEPDGYVLINSTRTFAELGLEELELPGRRMTVPATDLAREHLGRPMPNAVLLGGFAAISGAVTLDAVAAAIREKFNTKLAEGNIAAATAAYEYVKEAAVAPAG